MPVQDLQNGLIGDHNFQALRHDVAVDFTWCAFSTSSWGELAIRFLLLKSVSGWCQSLWIAFSWLRVVRASSTIYSA